MGIRSRLEKLEQVVEGLSTRATLQDGSVSNIGPGDRFDAVLSALKGEPHALNDPLQCLAPVQEDPTLHHVSNVLWMLGGDSDES